LTALSKDEGKRRRLGDHARERAARFSSEGMTSGLLQLYRRLGVTPGREAAA
jgi:hypothetical protein